MSKIIKAHSLTGRITDGLMLECFKAVKRNRGAAGIDKVSIKMFEANLADNLRALMRDLKTGSFEPRLRSQPSGLRSSLRNEHHCEQIRGLRDDRHHDEPPAV